jgi:predicted ATPase
MKSNNRKFTIIIFLNLEIAPLIISMQEKVVITGGPGTGKSTIVDQLQSMGYLCMPEISREIILEARELGIEQLFLEDPILFSKKLLEKRENQYSSADKSEKEIVFFDRGIHDIVAYLDFLKVDYKDVFLYSARIHRYSRIFLLPPWEEIYLTDNERYESFDQALSIYRHLKLTYNRFGYEMTEVPFGKVEDRVDYMLNSLKINL